MIKIKQLRTYAAAIMLATCTCTSVAEEILTLILDVKYWSNFKWADAVNSEVWQNQDFRLLAIPPRESSGERFLKSRKLDLAGRTYNALLIQSTAQTDYPNSFSLSLMSELRPRDCDLILAEWEKNFGTANTKLDNSYQAYAGFTLGGTQNDWKLKNTAAIANCETIGTAGSSITNFTIRFQSGALALPEAPINLQCTRVFSMASAPMEVRPALPLVFSVIPASAVVVDGAGILITKLTKLSATTIEFDTEVNDLINHFIIDRTSGALAGYAKSASLGRTVLNYSGQCDTRVPGKRRF